MIIREQQMQALSRYMEQNFQRQLVEEMREFAPWHARVLGESGVWGCVQFAMSRAARYGFTNRGPVRLYLQMIFLLGAEFHSDPLLPWAGETLADPTTSDQNDRASALYKKLTFYLERVTGPNKEYARNAVARADAEFARGLDGDGESSSAIFEKMQRVYPEKCS